MSRNYRRWKGFIKEARRNPLEGTRPYPFKPTMRRYKARIKTYNREVRYLEKVRKDYLSRPENVWRLRSGALPSEVLMYHSKEERNGSD